MFRQPANVPGVAPAYFRDDRLGETIERFLEESPIFIPAADHVAKPEHQKQVAVNTATFRVAQIRSVRGAILRGERAFLAECAGCRETLAGGGHSLK